MQMYRPGGLPKILSGLILIEPINDAERGLPRRHRSGRARASERVKLNKSTRSPPGTTCALNRAGLQLRVISEQRGTERHYSSLLGLLTLHHRQCASRGVTVWPLAGPPSHYHENADGFLHCRRLCSTFITPKTSYS